MKKKKNQDRNTSKTMFPAKKLKNSNLILFLENAHLYMYFKSRLSLIVRVNIVLNRRTVVVDSD